MNKAAGQKSFNSQPTPIFCAFCRVLLPFLSAASDCLFRTPFGLPEFQSGMI
jgi:hypothetical protein